MDTERYTLLFLLLKKFISLLDSLPSLFFFPFVPVFLFPGAYVRGSLFKEFLLLLFLSAFQNSGNRVLQNIKDLLVQWKQLIGLVCLIIIEVKSSLLQSPFLKKNALIFHFMVLNNSLVPC